MYPVTVTVEFQPPTESAAHLIIDAMLMMALLISRATKMNTSIKNKATNEVINTPLQYYHAVYCYVKRRNDLSTIQSNDSSATAQVSMASQVINTPLQYYGAVNCCVESYQI